MKTLLLAFLISFFSIALFAQGIRNQGANIVIQSGASVYIDGDANGKYLNESSGGSHGSIDLNGSIFIEGDWINNATSGNVFINNSGPVFGTVNFDGTAGQTIGGTRNTHFENMNFRNSTKTLAVDSTEVNAFRLLSADINLNQKVLIVNSNSVADLTASAGYGIISESTAPNFGILHWNIASSTGADFVIPFIDGVGGNSIPLTFRPNSGTTGSIRAATYHTPANNTPLPPTVNHLKDASTGSDNSALAADRFFMLEVSGSGVNADVTFTTTAAESAATTNPRAQRWLAGSDGWEAALGTQSNPTSNSVKAADISNFNTWWVLAPAANPLPISLVNFDAICLENSVLIEWVTASETNNDYFTIEKTTDRTNFETVAMVQGAGNSTNMVEYSITDEVTPILPTYYLLTQTDYDGRNKTYGPVLVKPCKQLQTAWNLQAIQAQSSAVRIIFQSNVNEIIDFDIFDITGNKIATTSIELFGGYQSEQLEVQNLSPGIYVGMARTSSDSQRLKFVISN